MTALTHRCADNTAMDLIATPRSTGAVRESRDEPVADEVVRRVLDTARRAGSVNTGRRCGAGPPDAPAPTAAAAGLGLHHRFSRCAAASSD
jgi:hypothetical protein